MTTRADWIVFAVLLLMCIGFVIEALRSMRDRPDTSAGDEDSAKGIEIVTGTGQKGRLPPMTGLRRYSPYFGEYIEVVAWVNDDHWSFRFVDGSEMGATYGGVFEARTRFSALPLKGPERVGYTPERKRRK